MRNDINTGRHASLLGSLWMIGAMAAFALEDAFIKAATADLPVAQVLVLFGLGGGIIFTAFAILSGESLFPAAVLSPPMLLRAGFEVTGRLFYVLAIALTPLAAATVVLQATPLVVIAVAALLFKERVGWRRWTAILVGLSGVLIILNPQAEDFSWVSLLAVLGMLGFAGRDLASRAAPASLGTSVLGFYGFASVVVAGGLFFLWENQAFRPLDGSLVLTLTGAVVAGALAYACLMKAMRTGEVSVVTPFRYTRLLFGMAAAVIWFGEDITRNMLAGSVLIVLSGLFILMRGRRA